MTYGMTFFCYFEGENNLTRHYVELEISNIPKWIECYRYTHTKCTAISVKVWFNDKVEI